MNAHQRRINTRARSDTVQEASPKLEPFKLYPHQEAVMEMLRNLPNTLTLDYPSAQTFRPMFAGLGRLDPIIGGPDMMLNRLQRDPIPPTIIIISPEWKPGDGEQMMVRLKKRRQQAASEFKLNMDFESAAFVDSLIVDEAHIVDAPGTTFKEILDAKKKS